MSLGAPCAGHPLLLATINSILMSFLRAITRCARLIPKLRTLFRQQRPYPPLCQLSSKSDNSSHHKLRISAFWRSSRAITRAVRARSQNQQRHFVGNAHVPLHADFRPNRIILATTFLCKTLNSCEPPTKLQSFYCGPYGPKSNYSLQSFLGLQNPAK